MGSSQNIQNFNELNIAVTTPSTVVKEGSRSSLAQAAARAVCAARPTVKVGSVHTPVVLSGLAGDNPCAIASGAGPFARERSFTGGSAASA